MKLLKLIVSSLVIGSVVALNPIGVSAEWKQDSNGWWNSDGNSWSVGWKENIFYDLNDIFGDQFAGYTKNISIKKDNSEIKKISNATGINLNDITKIIFYDGRGGRNRPVIVEDKQKVNEFVGYLDSYVINETKNPESVGWIQSAEFYINDKDVMGITFGDPIVANGNYYKVMKGGLDFKAIGKFIKSVDQSYDIMAGLE